MSNPLTSDEAAKQADFKKLQAEIYRDKVMRARAMTPEERLEVVFEMTDVVSQQRLAGILWQQKIDDLPLAKEILAKEIDRLRKLRDLTDRKHIEQLAS